jgi:hexosaminidase
MLAGNGLVRHARGNTASFFSFVLIAGLLAGATQTGHAQSTTPPAPEQAATALPTLIPMPRELHPGAELSLSHGVAVSAADRNPSDRFAAQDLVETLQKRGIAARAGKGAKIKIVLLRTADKKAREVLAKAHLMFDPAMRAEGYALAAEGSTIYDIAASDAGVFYGAQTIKQLIRGTGSNATMTAATIRDWPAMRYRGLSDDLSRGPVPTLAFQKHQVRVLAEYKVNIYSPYFENTLVYASNPLAAAPGGAMSKADVESLVQYAQTYHVEIVPEQEAFGHLHHTLEYDVYSPLAETPHGSVLAPGQAGSLPLIQSWFTEIAKIFPGPFIHIGADETFDLGKGQTKARVAKEGLGAVYIQFLRQIYSVLAPLHKKILFWGDIAMNSPELVKTLPKDMIAVAWVYNPQPDGYDKWLMPYVNAGMETWVAPGINNWRRVYPDFNAGFDNIQKFVADGQRLGSTGELNTVWNDEGEGLFNLDWYGVLYGAAAGWQPGASSIPQFQQAYGPVFHGDPTGDINQAQMELMAAQQVLEGAGLASTTRYSFWVDPWSTRGQEISAKLLPVVKEMRLHTERAITLLDQVRGTPGLRETDAVDAMEMGARRLDFLGYKFEAAQQMVEEYRLAYSEQNDPVGQHDVIHELGTITGVDGQCSDLRDGYGLMRDLYREAWLKENRRFSLDTVMAQYEMAMQLWIQRDNEFGDVIHGWYQTHTLPTPESLGLPPLPAATSAPATTATPASTTNSH